MKLSDRVKYIPITFAIIIVVLLISMGVLYIIRIGPFKMNKNTGIILIACWFLYRTLYRSFNSFCY